MPAPSEDATMVLPMGLAENEAAPSPPAAEEPPAFTMPPSAPAEGVSASMAPKGFMPIPDQSISAGGGAGPAEDGIDLGDDLLNEPTRILVVKSPAEPTVNLARELAEDLKGTSSADAELLLRKSERYIAKRNYYMARKILRHALAIGGDEQRIKDRLRDIRKLELPDGLYNAISSDDGAKEASGEILDRLEKEFDLLPDEEGAEAADLISNIDFQLENIFRETDPRTILDFGVALHEMGLFRQAETVFSRLVDEFPETSFDAYYLAAISKFARKDYAGAASILKTLSADGGKTEIEKIQVYYALGELFEKMQRPDSSKEFFRKVAELDANYRNIRHKLEE
jgi:tetratricopeptide (TPR) repeat protein